MLRDETEYNNEEELIIDDEEGLSIDNVDYHSIICRCVKRLDPRVIGMILKTFPDITTYVEYVEESHQEDIAIVGRIYEHLVRKAYRRYQIPVMLYYGLIDGTPKTLAEIAEIMGYPEEVIRNSIQCCLSPLFQKIHHERVRRTGLDKLFQD